MVVQWRWLCELFKLNGNAWFPGIAIVRDKSNLTVINHEKIHLQQQLELLYIGFILLYLFYQVKYGYDNNPLEVECNEHEYDLNYLKKRERYAWTKI